MHTLQSGGQFLLEPIIDSTYIANLRDIRSGLIDAVMGVSQESLAFVVLQD